MEVCKSETHVLLTKAITDIDNGFGARHANHNEGKDVSVQL